MEIQINKMELHDLEEIKDVLEKDFDDFWNYNIFKQELENKISYYLVAKENNKIVGFAGYMLILDVADLTNIVVNKDYRNKKIGYILLENIINHLKSIKEVKTITLEVSINNVYAIKLYESFGFQNLGIRKNYYENHTNAIIMTKYL